ncbi:MAG: hypothetical protein CMC97_02725 [Flavobacteriales bacterium]|nr:hypothetical protein [Flavobacteriales bacterium]
MLDLLLFSLAPWAAMLAVGWPLRQASGHRLALLRTARRPWTLVLGVALAIGFWQANPGPWWCLLLGMPGWAICPWLLRSVLRSTAQQKQRRSEMVAHERLWIIAQRGTVQQQIMRAREAEVIERRMRRCKSVLLLSRGNTEDLDFLLRRLENSIAQNGVSGGTAAEWVGGMAAHLRNVFIERDRDDLPLEDAVRHIRRWAAWLNDMGLDIAVEDFQLRDGRLTASKVPSMLFLGAAERWGIDALRTNQIERITWTWSISEGSVLLRSDSAGPQSWPSHTLKEWDHAFMLRHGGIAHAGGGWECQLPLLEAG